MIWGSGGSKSRLAKAAGAEPAGEMRDEKLHAVVARSPFRSQNVQNTPGPDHFWKLRCRKSARCCGAKHILKSKCTKHTIVGPLLEVAMSKKCTPLWRETHFQVKMYKTPHVCATFGGSDVEKCTLLWREAHFEVKMYKNTAVRATFGGSDVEKVHAVVARSTFRNFEVKMLKTPGVRTTFWGSDVASLRFTTLHYTTLHSTTLHYITLHSSTLQLQLHNYIHYTPLHSTTLNYTTLHYTTLHSTTLQYTTLHFTTLHYTPLHYNYNYTTTLHYAPLH